MAHVVLIGPIGVGKSTVAPLVADLMGREVVDLDALRAEFYAGLGYDEAHADEVTRREGVAGLLRYWKPFELALVEHVAALPDAVLDFGAGHSHFDDPEQFARAAAALAPHHVVLLLPSDDVEESMATLAERAPEEFREVTRELNRGFLTSTSNHALADEVILTAALSPETVAELTVAGLPRPW